MSTPVRWIRLLPYWFLLFTIGMVCGKNLSSYSSKHNGNRCYNKANIPVFQNATLTNSPSTSSPVLGGIIFRSRYDQYQCHNGKNGCDPEGLLGGLTFLGSALGAIILPPLFERYRFLRKGIIITSFLSVRYFQSSQSARLSSSISLG